MDVLSDSHTWRSETTTLQRSELSPELLIKPSEYLHIFSPYCFCGAGD